MKDLAFILTASFVRNCTEHSIMLVGGPSSLEGRVEVCVNGDWGTVTYGAWDYRDASVACRQLGFSPLGNTEVRCPGNPLSLPTYIFSPTFLSCRCYHFTQYWFWFKCRGYSSDWFELWRRSYPIPAKSRAKTSIPNQSQCVDQGNQDPCAAGPNWMTQ